MREMKHSGISWIGEIPADWELSKIGSLYDERSQKVSDQDYMPLSVTKQGIVPQLESTAKTDHGDSRKLIRKGDFVINSRSDRRGSCGISQYDGACSLINTVLRPRREMSNVYFSFVFRSDLFADEFYRWGNGIVDDLWSTKWSSMKRIYIPFPPLDVQRQIATYLDAKCAKIDAVIAKQQQVIEKLKAYKLSVITEAVTKGLNPDVPMKDSGIAWIGTVPSAWRIGQLKYFATVRSGITLGKKYPKDAELIEAPYLRVANVQGEFVDLTDVARIQVLPVEAEKYQLHRGELLMTEGGDRDKLGRGCVWNGEIEPCLHQNHVYAVTTDPQHLSVHFLDYMTTSAVARNYFDYTAKKTTNLASTNATTILQFRFPLPPVEEQLAIVQHLNQICQRLDNVIAQHSAIIDKLTEYKKSLVYEVVTGKREIDTDLPKATTVAVISPELLKYMKAVLMARLIDGLGNHVLGRVQVQKGLYFAETSPNLGLHLDTDYARYKHGPYDREIQSYEAIMAEHGWIYTSDEQDHTIYRRGEQFSEYWGEYQRLFPNCEGTVQRIIDFVKQFQYTKDVEKVATLFAAWNDFIIDGITSPTDEAIIAEVRNHWTENKGKIKERTWRKSLAQLKSAQFIPQGHGKHTVKWQGGQAHG